MLTCILSGQAMEKDYIRNPFFRKKDLFVLMHAEGTIVNLCFRRGQLHYISFRAKKVHKLFVHVSFFGRSQLIPYDNKKRKKEYTGYDT